MPRGAAGAGKESDCDERCKYERAARYHRDSSFDEVRDRAEHNPTRCAALRWSPTYTRALPCQVPHRRGDYLLGEVKHRHRDPHQEPNTPVR